MSREVELERGMDDLHDVGDTTVSHRAGARPRRRSRAGLWFGGALVAMLVTAVGVRFQSAVTERKAIAAAMTSAAPKATERHDGVAVVRGVPDTWEPTLPITGTLNPVHESNIGFKVSGRLSAVHVKVGDAVKEGRLLATLDPLDASAQMSAASAQVKSAEVELGIARDNEARTRALLEKNAIAAVEHVTDEQRVASAQARLEQARAQSETASAALRNTQLVAPFSGLVTAAPSAPGAIVTLGTVLFRVEDTSALRLNATMSADDAPLAAIGAEVVLEGSRAAGKVTAILPSVDAQTRRIPIIAEIPNGGSSPLLAGVFVRATIRAGGTASVLKLPGNTVRPGSQDEVAVVRDGKARLTRLTFARAADGALLVRAGLSPNDDVLVSPSAELKDGDAVTIAPASGK